VVPLSVRKHDRLRLLLLTARRKLARGALVLAGAGALSVVHIDAVSREDNFDRIQAGQWVVASMYWQDKLVASGKKFEPIGWHAAHKTLPLGTHIRVTNPENRRSINITINDRGPYVDGRELDLTLGAGTLLGFDGLGMLYMEVLSFPPDKIDRPVLENLFAVNEK
jgi:rare lipoprotein A (peptidoglycan hydrolase)